MKLAIIGSRGVLGSVLADSFKTETDHTVVEIDPKIKMTPIIEEVKFFIGAAIVCVPTPANDDGSCDLTILNEVLSSLGTDIPILVKSTVPPTAMATWPKNITYSPEFLREKHAFADWNTQQNLILGTDVDLQYNFWQKTFRHKDFVCIRTTRETASMVKYVHNAWLAMKTVFFGELAQNNIPNVDYNEMIQLLAKFENIGPSHMEQPGPDGKYGYGGSCFPKDTSAMGTFIESEMLHTMLQVNKDHRQKG